MTDRKTLEQHNIEHNLSTTGLFPCENCNKPLPAFALADASTIDALEGDFVCGTCIIDLERATIAASEQFTLNWADVRMYRARLLQQCDWTQTLDVSQTVRDEWAPVREALRNLPQEHQEASDAWTALKQIEQEHFV